jgi:hypothetical protein
MSTESRYFSVHALRAEENAAAVRRIKEAEERALILCAIIFPDDDDSDDYIYSNPSIVWC